MPAGRPTRLADPDFCVEVAEAYINGMSRDEMATLFGCHKDTITNWVRDPRVQSRAAKFAQERVTRITRKIDKEIEGRLAGAEEMDTELLLKVRKEFIERAVKIDLGGQQQTADTVNETVEALEENPDLAKQLTEMLAKRGK